jgi:hypothetical protein
MCSPGSNVACLHICVMDVLHNKLAAVVPPFQLILQSQLATFVQVHLSCRQHMRRWTFSVKCLARAPAVTSPSALPLSALPTSSLPPGAVLPLASKCLAAVPLTAAAQACALWLLGPAPASLASLAQRVWPMCDVPLSHT